MAAAYQLQPKCRCVFVHVAEVIVRLCKEYMNEAFVVAWYCVDTPFHSEFPTIPSRTRKTQLR